MSNARFYLDEDIYGAIAPALRKAGIDALSTLEAGRSAEADESQLEWATSNERAIVTFNVGHFADLHSRWLQEGRRHAGIVVSAQRPIGELLRRLLHLAETMPLDSLKDRLEFLSDW
jgi:hypothetical protein